MFFSVFFGALFWRLFFGRFFVSFCWDLSTPGKTQICMLQEAKRLDFGICVIAHKGGGREVKGETILTCFRRRKGGKEGGRTKESR